MQFKGNIDSCSTFWRIGKDSWRPLIDGEHQGHGRLVFDQGLHNGNFVEPGYFKSIDAACSYLMPEIINRNNFEEIYLKTHAIACRHFDVSLNCGILMNATETGRFRTLGEGQVACRMPLDEVQSTDPLNELNLVNEEIAALSAGLGLDKPLASLSIDTDDSTRVYVQYHIPSSDISMAVETILSRFYERMEKALSQDEEITLIAELYQALEWLHPFRDGQGRTDGLFLNKFLCDHGKNPCILQKPYFSTVNRLATWKDYLIKGMELWKSITSQVDLSEMSETHHKIALSILDSNIPEDERLATLHNFNYIEDTRSKFKTLMFNSIQENSIWNVVKILDVFYNTFPLMMPLNVLDAEVNEITARLSRDGRDNLNELVRNFKKSQPKFNNHWY